VGPARYSLIATLCLATSIASAGPRGDELRPPRDRPPTRAQRATAQRHYVKATKWYKTGDYDRALEELHHAFETDARAEYLYAIGRVHVKLDHCADAVTYLERFIDTNPGPLATRAAKQAIDDCKAKVPPPADEPKPNNLAPPEEKPKDATKEQPTEEPTEEPTAQAPASKPKPKARARTPWYSDKIGDGLLIGGFALGGTGAFFYVSALGELDAAESSQTLAEHIEHFDSARSRRLYSLVLGGAGITLATVAVVHFIRYDRRERRTVAVVPTDGGGMAVLAGRF
jgi:tetratricopeptide (TPR) repeat protein